MTITDYGEIKIAEIPAAGNVIQTAQDALQLLMDCHYSGTRKLIIHEQSLTSDFFDLKTGLAGDILQKFSNYDGYVAIVGDFSRFTSKSLHDFIRESNRLGRVSFVASREEALAALRKTALPRS